MCVRTGKNSVYRIWYHPWFWTSTGSLGNVSPTGKGNYSASPLILTFCNSTTLPLLRLYPSISKKLTRNDPHTFSWVFLSFKNKNKQHQEKCLWKVQMRFILLCPQRNRCVLHSRSKVKGLSWGIHLVNEDPF